MRIRTASRQDQQLLAFLNLATWDMTSSPAPAPPADRDPFERREPEDHLIAELDDQPVGYVQVGHPTPLDASRHVIEIQGLGVLPEFRGRGVARALMRAAIDEARRRSAQKVSLRVLGGNEPAQALYRSLGFEVQGRLLGEFLIDGQLVDDVLMARPVGPGPDPL